MLPAGDGSYNRKPVFSNQGKNFHGAQQQLRDWIDTWNVTQIKGELAANRRVFQFDWEFNVPKASHVNGVVESLIRSWRRGLDAAVNYFNRRFTFEEWQTFLSEVMYLVNLRPLFPVGSPAITGNDFDQPTVPQPGVEANTNARNMVKALQQRVHMFWETRLR